MDFYYDSNKKIHIGDVVYTGNISNGEQIKGIVKKIISPKGIDAENYDCSNFGGILIEEDWGDGRKNLLVMTPPDGKFWEDLNLIERCS